MQKTMGWGSFAAGSVGFAIGVLLTQTPGLDHRLDLLFLVGSTLLLGVACWLLLRVTRAGILRNTALTIAVLEALTATYAVASIVTYSR